MDQDISDGNTLTGKPCRLLLRPTEVADTLGIGRSKVYELISSGQLPSIRIGGSLRVPLTQLTRWIELQVRASMPERGL